MGSSSINTLTFPLHSQTKPKNPQFTHKSHFITTLNSKPIKIKPPHFQKLLHFLPKHHLKLPHKPISNLSKQPSPPTPKKIFSQKVVYFLLGSFIVLGGGFYSKSHFLPNFKSYSSNLEEKRETHDEELRNEGTSVMGLSDIEALKVWLYENMRKGKTKEALGYIERLIETEPNEVEWKLLEALCYDMMGQLSKSKRLFKEILGERPLLLRALHGLAMVMHKNHEGHAVFEMLNKALELARREERVTEERNIRILIGQMHVVKGELEDGLEKFQQLIDENPKDFRPYLCQGIIYSLMDKKKEAEEQFETYRSLVPEEFPQRGFLDDVALSAKSESQQRLHKDLDTQFSYRK